MGEEQKLKNEQMLAKEVNLAGREQQCSFRWAKLSTMLQKFEAEEEQKRQQREAGTKRLEKMKATLAKTQEVFNDKVNTTEVLGGVLDLDAAFESRMAAKAQAKKRKALVEWGKRKSRNTAKAKVDTFRRAPAKLSRTKSVPIYAPAHGFTRSSKGNLVFDKNRNVITKKKAISRQSKKVKALDRQLSVLESEKSRLLRRLNTLESVGKQVSPVLVKRLDRQIGTLSQKCQKLNNRKFQLANSSFA